MSITIISMTIIIIVIMMTIAIRELNALYDLNNMTLTYHTGYTSQVRSEWRFSNGSVLVVIIMF